MRLSTGTRLHSMLLSEAWDDYCDEGKAQGLSFDEWMIFAYSMLAEECINRAEEWADDEEDTDMED
jgi:hypothetical protein